MNEVLKIICGYISSAFKKFNFTTPMSQNMAVTGGLTHISMNFLLEVLKLFTKTSTEMPTSTLSCMQNMYFVRILMPITHIIHK